jgi:hypothetical protein
MTAQCPKAGICLGRGGFISIADGVVRSIALVVVKTQACIKGIYALMRGKQIHTEKGEPDFAILVRLSFVMSGGLSYR